MDFCQIIGTSCTNMWKLRLPTKMKSLVDGCLPRLSLSSSSSFPWLLPTCRGCGEAKISVLHEENLNLRWQLYERDSNVNTLFPLKKWTNQEFLLLGKQKWIWLVSMRRWIQSLALLSGSGIQRCHELWCGLQTWLGSCVVVAVAPIQTLSWELLYATDVTLETKKKPKTKKQPKPPNKPTFKCICCPRISRHRVKL